MLKIFYKTYQFNVIDDGESEYDISLDAAEKAVSLKKKNEPSETSQYYDDGIMIQFE